MIKAIERQQEFKHFYNDSSPELVIDKVASLLTPQKLQAFRKVYNNHAQVLFNRVVTHYSKVNEAHGRVLTDDLKVREIPMFNELRETMYNGKDDISYWKEDGHVLSFLEPGALHFKGVDKDKKVKSVKIPVEAIHDMDANEGGISYVIIKEKKEETDYFHVYDESNYYTYTSTEDGFERVNVNDGNFSGSSLHGAKKCPFDFIYDDNESTDNHIIKKTPISDSMGAFYSYVILRTFYENYKYFSAFGREIKPEARCDYKDPSRKVACNKGMLQSVDPLVQNPAEKCPACSGKNTGMMGEVFEIPINLLSNSEFVKGLPNLYHRYDADEGVLRFHLEDIQALKQEILEDCIGKGFGVNTSRIAINQDQVRSNFDDQESNLVWFSERKEKTWSNDWQRCLEISGSKSTAKIILGRKYFLKDVGTLYEELEQMQKSTSNYALINGKLQEITLTENRHNERFIERKQLIDMLQPFSSLTSEYVTSNRDRLDPDAVALYDRFGEVFSLFEYTNGDVETYGSDLGSNAIKIKRIKEEFNLILKELQDDNRGNADSAGGQAS